MSEPFPPPFRKVRFAALALGAAAAVGCAALAAGDVASFLQGYLFAYFAACFVSAGCLGLLALGNLTGGKWAIASRPVSGEAARAQDRLCRLPERYLRLADRVEDRIARRPRAAFDWIHGRTA